MFEWLYSKTKTKKIQKERLTESSHIPIQKNIQKNKDTIKQIIGDSTDIFMRDLEIDAGNKTIDLLMIGISGLIDEESIRDGILNPLLSTPFIQTGHIMKQIKNRIYLGDIKEEDNLYQGILDVFQGNAFLIIDGFTVGIVIENANISERDIEEPPTDTVVRGSRDGFVETIETNISLLRRRISHPSLRFKSYTLGEYSQTKVVLSYIDGVIDPEIIQRIDSRINEIEVDDITSGGQIEQYLADNPYTFFPLAGNTERPDQAVSKIMEGRMVLLVDGSPMTLFYPHFFWESMHSIEDYNSNPVKSSILRMLRFMAFIISILLPAFYIAVVNIHKNVIPSEFIIALENSREGVPLPLLQETILLIILFQMVKEGGTRMPKGIGEALSIVGALILGEVSVSAGLISSQTIIVVATAAITSFIVTPVAGAVSVLRILYIIPAYILGFYGLIIAVLVTVTHMIRQRSMGVPYMSPVAPLYLRDWNDLIIRMPFKFLKFRPKSVPHLKPIRYKKTPSNSDEGQDTNEKK